MNNPTQIWTRPTGTTYKVFNSVLAEPHILIAGMTGSGKSVFMDGLMFNIMHRYPINKAGGANLIFLDPKGTEFQKYESLPHTLIYEYRQDHYIDVLESTVELMEARFSENRANHQRLYDGSDVYLMIDEWADIRNVCGLDAVRLLQRLCQKGRASRIHVILATQHPSTKVIPEEVRGNFDCRVCLRTSSWKTSRMVIDTAGAERLEIGTCILHTPDRILQGKLLTPVIVPYIEDDELERLVSFWTCQIQNETA